MKKTVFIIATLCCIGSAAAASKPDVDNARTGFQPLSWAFEGASSAALGQGGTTLSGPGAILRNPSLIGRAEGPQLTTQYGAWLRDADVQNALVELLLPLKGAAIGLTLASNGISDIGLSDDFGNRLTGTAYSRLSTLQAALAWSPFEDVTMGFSVGGTYEHIVDSRAFALTAGLGAIISPTQNLRAGLSISSIGITTPMADTNETFTDGEPLPFTVRLGGSWTDTIKGVVPFSAQIDVRYDYAGDTASDISGNMGKRITVPVGISVTPVSFLTIRAGKRILFPGELFDFGLGLSVAPFTVDAGFSVPRFDKTNEFRFTTAITFSPDRAGKKPPKTRMKLPADTVHALPADSVKVPAPIAPVSAASPDSLKVNDSNVVISVGSSTKAVPVDTAAPALPQDTTSSSGNQVEPVSATHSDSTSSVSSPEVNAVSSEVTVAPVNTSSQDTITPSPALKPSAPLEKPVDQKPVSEIEEETVILQ